MISALPEHHSHSTVYCDVEHRDMELLTLDAVPEICPELEVSRNDR